LELNQVSLTFNSKHVRAQTQDANASFTSRIQKLVKWLKSCDNAMLKNRIFNLNGRIKPSTVQVPLQHLKLFVSSINFFFMSMIVEEAFIR